MRMLTINIMQSKTIAKGNIATTVPRIQPSIGTAPSLGVPDKLLLLIGFENPTCLYSRYLLCWLRDHLCHLFHRLDFDFSDPSSSLPLPPELFFGSSSMSPTIAPNSDNFAYLASRSFGGLG